MSTLRVKTELPFNELLSAVEQLSLPEMEKLLSRVIVLQARRKAPSLPKNEASLLLKINQRLPPDQQGRFDELVAKRQDETITPNELAELLRLTEQVERSDVERLKCLAQLADKRAVPLNQLMSELGIHPPSYAR